ncbi:Rrf2 family transcriptional regulator [Scytonema hofmannii PCC 7110]|jgi:Rrf2 family protein|uniref:Rrf2 family transcriptional regulator n=1 Tax=Scytonema hofmannii PCC 7110 TaxID=128403 RepID=A0A139WWF0_9CYAN|nr:Rrf2 family transcriptional regulator [Scytonema hofmannii]KYC36769.1 Rrf2 family transcriptional regulator [Scytonema hofmannii PCC 7110]
MKLSNKSEYAILAMVALAKKYHNNESLHIREIAALQKIPNRYLEQLLATLRSGGLIKSIRGSKGGYILARDPKKITVLDILKCIEGVDAALPTVDSACDTVEAETIQEVWLEANQAAHQVLQKYTLQELCDRQATRQQIENMYYI